jgi:hypothetical protein
MITDKPYDEAKKRWKYIAIYAVCFAATSVLIRYGLHF